MHPYAWHDLPRLSRAFPNSLVGYHGGFLDSGCVLRKPTTASTANSTNPTRTSQRNVFSFLAGLELGSPPVKTPRVLAQNGGFVFMLEIGPFQDFVDFFHAIGESNLMGEVRREHERLGADALNGVGKGFFVSLAADKNQVGCEILLRMARERETTIFHLPCEPVDHQRNPGGAAFHEAHAELGKAIEDAVDDHARLGDGQRT